MTTTVLLAPHHDDECLFAAFQILRVKPHVIVCTRALVQQQRGYTFERNGEVLPISPLQREIETRDALEVLGADYWEQWDIPDGLENQPVDAMRSLKQKIYELANDYFYCIAPAYEEDGHFDHNAIAWHAWGAFDQAMDGDRLTQYTTYTKEGRSRNGRPVEFEPHWPALKMRALACYESQIQHPSTRPHFMGDLWEYTI